MKNYAGLNSKLFCYCLLLLLFLILPEVSQGQMKVKSVIFSSDLFSPPDDPDDHFDLLTLLSLDNITVKAVILDVPVGEHNKELGRASNYDAVKNALKIFNREPVPTAAGLKRQLPSMQSSGADFPKDEQGAIELIIQQLRAAEDKSITIITTGSVRDIAAAYNREPLLFAKKVERLMISVGDSYGLIGIKDHNTSLDVEAWKILMSADLPIDWMPTNPTKGRGGPSPYTSFWYFMQGELIPFISEDIISFFKDDGIPITDNKWRPMWSTPAFIEAAQLKCYMVNDKLQWLSAKEAALIKDKEELKPYEFVPIDFALDKEGKAVWKTSDPKSNTGKRIFRINDYFLYHQAMFEFLKTQLGKGQ